FPDAPWRPLSLLAGDPVQEERNYSAAEPDAVADLYYLPDGARHGAVLLLLGARPFPKRDPQLVNLASGLARAGAAVMIAEPPNLTAGRIVPSETRPIADAFRFARSRAYVDPDRIGYVALSVGGSLVLLAVAEDRELGEGLAFANVFSAYYDAVDMLWSLTTETMTERGETLPSQPAPRAEQL